MDRPVGVTDAGDPLLADFVALGNPATRRRVEREGGYFVVEGIVAIERLLDLPRWRIRSLALLPKVADRLADRLTRIDAPVAVADETVLREVVGFDIHRGALASVERAAPEAANTLRPVDGDLLLVAEGINDHENLGALYRNAAAFGARAVLLDDTCADPFYRRSVRVSLGHVLAVPTLALGSMTDGLHRLHDQGVTTLALSPRGDRSLHELIPAGLGPGPLAIVVGAEGPGLSDAALRAATYRLSIPMATGVDSLNVATAAAIALHHVAPGP